MRLLALILFLTVQSVTAQSLSPEAQAWFNSGREFVEEKRKQTRGPRRARNVILFIGDGMGLTTVTASRIYEGQLKGNSGEENLLSFEQFPHTALSKTYAVDRQVTDSASTATAMVTGVKTNFRKLSMDETASPASGCETGKLTTLLERAETAGLATGVVSNTRLTHATPASLYAHAIDRGMEMQGTDGCKDIAAQLIEFSHGDGLEVAMGGGAPLFMSQSRADKRDLTREWLDRYEDGAVVTNATELRQLGKDKRHVLGLFSRSHMAYELHREKAGDEPSLTEMTETAINLVSAHPKGFFLMIEGGRIDHGHHAGNAKLALTETVEFSNAIRRATEMVGKDTLIIVTADHSHTLTMAGYPHRGSPILGIADNDVDGRPYTTLGYANGPGYRPGTRRDLSEVDTTDDAYLQEATVPRNRETHGGEDVPVYAIGPGSQWVQGVMEQHVIYHIMAKALLGN